jgi:Na+-driven multidrug efflux pump
MVVMTVLGLPLWLIPDLVSRIFIHDATTRDIVRWPMRLVGLTMPIEALGFAFMHALLGAGDAKGVMYTSIGIQWLVLLPLAYLIGPILGFGLLAIWLLQGGTRSIQSAIFLLKWKRRQWQAIVV